MDKIGQSQNTAHTQAAQAASAKDSSSGINEGFQVSADTLERLQSPMAQQIKDGIHTVNENKQNYSDALDTYNKAYEVYEDAYNTYQDAFDTSQAAFNTYQEASAKSAESGNPDDMKATNVAFNNYLNASDELSQASEDLSAASNDLSTAQKNMRDARKELQASQDQLANDILSILPSQKEMKVLG